MVEKNIVSESVAEVQYDARVKRTALICAAVTIIAIWICIAAINDSDNAVRLKELELQKLQLEASP